MTPKKTRSMSDYLEPLNINGLQGRMLHAPAPKGKNREFLFIYGHHSSLERMFGFAEALNRYGAVTMPDLPGLGGMESFYKISMKPSIDNMADYLAAFIKFRYKRRRISIIGLSLGFVVITRMLQKYPEIAERVDLLVSIVGFVHRDDFIFKRRNLYTLRYASGILAGRLPAWFIQQVLLRPTFIRTAYKLVENKHVKFKDADEAERERRINFEVGLWQINDVRTYMYISSRILNLDLCNSRVGLPVYHISVSPDHFFDHKVVEQHLGVIYDLATEIKSNMKGHSHTVIATAKDVAPFFPPKFRRLLASK